jgi:hypothetical protein
MGTEGMKPSKVFSVVAGLIVLMLPASNVRGQTFTGQELLARPTDHSVTLNVVSSSALDAYIEYGTSSGAYTNTTSTVSQAANEPIVIVMDGLSANTKYYYRLRYRNSGSGSFLARAEHTFRTQRPAGSTFTFDVTSDSHVNIMLGNGATWTQTLTNVATDNPDYLIDLGDTFAMDGVSSEATARTNYIYQRSSSFFGLVSHSASIFIVPGNHENQEGWHLNDNSDPAQTEPVWSTNAQKRYFPNPVPNDFYTGNTDTYYALNGDQLHEDYYAWTWGDALFVAIDPFWYTTTKPFIGNTGGGEPGTGDGDRWHWTLGDTQYWWLKNTLENSTAKYKFLFMHHPTGGTDDYIRGGAAAGTYCEWGGYNEDGTTWGFTTRRPTWPKPIHQILIDNGVSIVFHGHDHQYAYEKRDGIVYQELPSGGFSGNGFNQYQTGVGYTIKALPSPGHLRVTVSASQTTVEYVNSTTANGSNGSVAYSYTVLPTSIAVNTKIFLGGPYNGVSMNTTLKTAGLIPLSHPYDTAPWNYTGTESVGGIPANVVDWVLVELRTGRAASTKVAARAAFVKNDGSVVDLNGTSAVSFWGRAAGSYYIVIRHRNHLAIMSASAVPLSSSSSLYDFTSGSGQYYGTTNAAKDLGSGVWGMLAGDVNVNAGIGASDLVSVLGAVGSVAYDINDVNMNGGVGASDLILTLSNIGYLSQVP